MEIVQYAPLTFTASLRDITQATMKITIIHLQYRLKKNILSSLRSTQGLPQSSSIAAPAVNVPRVRRKLLGIREQKRENRFSSSPEYVQRIAGEPTTPPLRPTRGGLIDDSNLDAWTRVEKGADCETGSVHTGPKERAAATDISAENNSGPKQVTFNAGAMPFRTQSSSSKQTSTPNHKPYNHCIITSNT